MTDESEAAAVAATRTDADTTVKATRVDEGLVLAASRHNRINMLWEYTQAFLAIALVTATIYASLRLPREPGTATQVPETLKNATFVVIGFYFGRTNHARPTGHADDN